MFKRAIAILLSLVGSVTVSGCSDIHYARVNRGTLKGKLTVRWIGPDQFIFIPDTDDPLRFTRSNGDIIKPGKMYTDGGSIPRILWAFRSYSPWGYAPAFIVHDWLFDMHHCQYEGHERYDVHEAALVMSEVLKTMREDKPEDGPSKFVIYSMFLAVDSSIASSLWDNGKCQTPPAELMAKKPAMEYVISYP